MAKVNPCDFNPAVMPPDWTWHLPKSKSDIDEDTLELMKAAASVMTPEDIEATPWLARHVNAATDTAQQDFELLLARAYAEVAKADTTNVINKVYTHIPLAVSLEYAIGEEADGDGLEVVSKMGGIPDLRGHWSMKYRKDKSLAEAIAEIWPRHPSGGFLSHYATVNISESHCRTLKHTHSNWSTFTNIKSSELRSPHTTTLAMFGPWQPDFDYRLDACILELGAIDESIEVSEYLRALNALGLLKITPDEDGDISSYVHWPLLDPKLVFDIDLYYGWYCVPESIVVPKKHREAMSMLSDTITWTNAQKPKSVFHQRSNTLTLGGSPRSQQEEARYMDVSSYPCPKRMTPFANFNHPTDDMTYQIYTSAYPYDEVRKTYCGKVDSSCT